MSKETYCGQPCCFTTVANTAKKMLLIELTNKCNLACPYCHSRPNEGGNNALGYERLVRLLDECRENNFDTVIVSGGEPLVSPDVFRFAEEIRNRGLQHSKGTISISFYYTIPRTNRGLQLQFLTDFV